MNRRGFTLIEVLAVIVLIGIIGVLIVPGLFKNIDTAKETAYKTLIKNIISSSQTYYEECEYGDLTDIGKYGEYACDISNNTITTTLGTLANTGFLKVNKTKPLEDGTEIKVIINPINNDNISDCKIKITKVVEPTTYKVAYEITNIDTNSICPNIYE